MIDSADCTSIQGSTCGHAERLTARGTRTWTKSMSGPILAIEVISVTDSLHYIIYAEHNWVFAISILSNNGGLTADSLLHQKNSIHEDAFHRIGLPVFSTKVVHNIAVQERDGTKDRPIFCTFGNDALRVVQIKASQSDSVYIMKAQSDEKLLDDVIIAVKFTSSRLAAITAHNVLFIFSENLQILEKIVGLGRSMLSSACLFQAVHDYNSVSSSGGLVLIGGTYFGDLFACVSFPNPVLHKIGHGGGVIFSIDYQPSQEIFCSTSDDRCCRIYQIKFKSALGGTGNIKSETDWNNPTFQLLKTLFGHEARVWKGKILGNHIITIGEDSRCCVWDKNGKLVDRWTVHSGSNIWSLCVTESADCIAFTGGGDGAITARKVTGERTTCSFSLEPNVSNSPGNERVRQVAITDEDKLLVLTDGGTLYAVQTCTESNFSVEFFK